MELQMKKVGLFSPVNREVDRLLDELFPREERYSMWLLKLLSLRRMTSYEAFFDGDTFVGFFYDFHTEDIIFGLYLAVDSRHQSKGYGSAIMRLVRERYGDREMAFHIEAPDEPSDNQEQRQKRLRLYERLGYRFTGYSFRDPERYWVMSDRGEDFNRAAYEKLFRRLSFGFYKPKLTRE